MLCLVGTYRMTWNLSHLHTHTHRGRNWICAIITFTQRTENAPVGTVLQISPPHPILMLFLPLPALSGDNVWPEVKTSLSVLLFPDTQLENGSAPPSSHLCLYIFLTGCSVGTESLDWVYNSCKCRSIESLRRLHNTNLVTSMAESGGELELSGRPLNDAASHNVGRQSGSCPQCILNS